MIEFLALAPIDPGKTANQTQNDLMHWFATNGPLIIGAIILSIVGIAVFRALPKWLFLIIAVVLAAIVVGVSFKQ